MIRRVHLYNSNKTASKTSALSTYGFARYFLLTALLSFLGWAFEVGVMKVQTGKFYNQGFITLPFCPIYGCSLIITYFLLGTPDCTRGILKRVQSKRTAYALYLLFAFCVPTIAELIVGAFFDYAFHVQLWSYSHLPLNFRGYISMPISLAWSALIFLFMKYIFSYLKRFIGKIPKGLSGGIAFALAFILLVDFSLNLALLIA